MTNSQPEDIQTRVASLEEQLEQVLESLDLIATVQRGIRVELRETSQTSARLERTVRQLAEISARTQVVVVRQQDELEQYRADIRQNQADIRQNQENIKRMLDYLENPHRGDTMPN
jgi:chromosome segregation ATPase